jgi:hypothetical protein
LPSSALGELIGLIYAIILSAAGAKKFGKNIQGRKKLSPKKNRGGIARFSSLESSSNRKFQKFGVNCRFSGEYKKAENTILPHENIFTIVVINVNIDLFHYL